MQLSIYNNNLSNNITFESLHIKNKHSWDSSRLSQFCENEKIKTFVQEVDKLGADVVARPYNYVDSGNNPKNFGVFLGLRLKEDGQSKTGVREMLMKAYHCAIPTMLEGFNPKKTLVLAKRDIQLMKNGQV